MSLPSVMLFVSMKMSRGRAQPLHCTASLADQGTALSFVMLTGSFKGPLVKKACGLRSVSGWAKAEASWAWLWGPGAGVILWFLILLIPVRTGLVETNPLPEVLRIQTLRLSNCII